MTLTLLPIQDATRAQVAVAYGRGIAGSHDFVVPDVLANMIGRAGLDVPIDLICDDLGPAGWAGLTPYGLFPDTWESTTFLAPRLRGTHAFALARCLQAHRVDDLVTEHGQVRVLTSTAQSNTRSVSASRRYAAHNGWPAGRFVEEPHKNRTSFVLDWPVPVPHTCLLPETQDVVA
jgi:hypothetical protein